MLKNLLSLLVSVLMVVVVTVFPATPSIVYAQSVVAEGQRTLVPDKNWKKTLEADLETVYKPTVLARKSILSGSFTGSRTGAVEDAGTVLVVKKAGILTGGIDYGFMRQSTVRDGELTKIFQQAEDRQYLLKPGDRVYVMDVKVGDDAVSLRIMTADSVEKVVSGTTISDRYNVMVKFEYDKALLPFADVAALQKVVSEILATEEEATAPKTIALGQTKAEVESVLGAPTTVINLGAKVTFVYPNMKVIFVDGKVSDVQ